MSKRTILLRFLHTTIPQNQILVGPPHPVSNLRPVLYNGIAHDDDHAKPINAYSPNELQSHIPIDPDKFQLDLTLKALDKFNHDFWVEVSTRSIRWSALRSNTRAEQPAVLPTA